MKPTVYIDGQSGTTGLQIRERLTARTDIELLTIEESRRHDPKARRELLNAADLSFLCLPDDAAREAMALIEDPRARVIDASTAHRTAAGWVYGFPELTGQRDRIQTAERVANPGCYATGFISLVRPLVEKGLLSPEARVCCHALSGYTGGGKNAIAQYEAAEREEELESPRHYAVGLAHKHLPEMAALTGLARPPLFAPIICDFPRGMLVSVPLWAEDVKGASIGTLRALYEDYYRGSEIVTLRPADAPACGFIGSNDLAGLDSLQIFVNGNGAQLLLSARLDNLGKGASGAAVQNMNLMLGFPETTGLKLDRQATDKECLL